MYARAGITRILACKGTTKIWNTQVFEAKKQIYLIFLTKKLVLFTFF